MSRRIMVVNPNTTASMTDAVLAAARPVAAPGTTLVRATARHGVDSIESNVDEVCGALSVLELVRSGEADGIDGYVVACFGDTGVAAAREAARGPVVGMTEAALFTAALLAARFAIITLPPRTAEQSQRVLRAAGLEHRCTVHTLDVAVSDVAAGSTHLLESMAEAAEQALHRDAAEAIILGCAGLADLVAPLTERLGVPVVEGVAAAVGLVDSLLAQQLTTSRASTYAAPQRWGPPT